MMILPHKFIEQSDLGKVFLFSKNAFPYFGIPWVDC